MRSILLLGISGLLAACASAPPPPHHDVLIRDGLVFDGSGAPGQRLDVAIDGDRISALLPPGSPATADRIIDAQGQYVAPGFINVLSWATESLLLDGRGQSDLLQGVTLEIFGEGWSMGPLNERMKADALKLQGDFKFEIDWTTLGEYLETLERRGVSPNVASFVGATTVRIHVLGEADVQPDAQQLAQMRALVDAAMREGALGVGASLIYPPAFYAQPAELVALARTAARHGGGYIVHQRSEADRLLEAVDETINVARETGQRAEAYHLKAAGRANWPKMAQAIAAIEAARNEGLAVSANMYAYTAGATGLTASLPPWTRDGGHDALMARLADPAERAKILDQMRAPADGWENLYHHAGSPERVRLIGFKNDALKPLTGKTLAEVMALRGSDSAEDTILDLIAEDDSRVDAAYELMSEDNVELGLRQPWVSLGSDAEASSPEGLFLLSSTHPRAYGNVARFLGHYVRERQLLGWPEAIHRLTGLPAENWKLVDRG
ncbi:MAG: amidohydrolase family protein, partial [Xanthomonadales bacterium]|nr:amidohydrolase family protein [Xanthomonadales bacterium]